MFELNEVYELDVKGKKFTFRVLVSDSKTGEIQFVCLKCDTECDVVAELMDVLFYRKAKDKKPETFSINKAWDLARSFKLV